VNITDQGFPKEIAALQPWHAAYEKDWRFSMAFATSIAADPEGKYPLGTSGSGYLSEYDTSINYHSDRFLKYLNEALDRYKRLSALAADTTLDAKTRAERTHEIQSEIFKSLADANKAKR